MPYTPITPVQSTDTFKTWRERTNTIASEVDKRSEVITSTADPTNTNDQYVVGSIWYNSTTGDFFVCRDNTSLNAVWTLLPKVVKKTASPSASDFTYSVGTIWVNETSNEAYICVETDFSTAAVWGQLSLDISDLGTMALQDSNAVNITGGNITGIADLAIADGGTGASTASAARTNLDVYSKAETDDNIIAMTIALG